MVDTFYRTVIYILRRSFANRLERLCFEFMEKENKIGPKFLNFPLKYIATISGKTYNPSK